MSVTTFLRLGLQLGLNDTVDASLTRNKVYAACGSGRLKGSLPDKSAIARKSPIVLV